ncbi:Probable multidrug resistance ABC transporter ATP-binding/permease protein YheI [Arcanobacterium haemolyticum]|uniref:ABC transporter transmembrane region n=2 Tax=Arcanobacterium haemolyticum TaxID=28264 RepID=D7BNF1_ARCHD|nr:ABC transporter transmembrane region [Arcanobacterium haemolyticum DSM 20595]SQH28821.1 Probable multidrug resistance ABC transporter ATP-binding/permease protein YheI [Arcanobacterium haemolyticum]
MILISMAKNFLADKKMIIGTIIVLQLSQVLFNLWLPNLNAHIIDNGIVAGNQPYIWRTGLLMIGVSCLQIISLVTAMYLSSRLAMAMGRDLRLAVFRHVQRFSLTDQQRFGASTLITRATNDVTQIQRIVMGALSFFVIAPLLGVGGIIMSVIEDPQLSLLLLVVVPLLAVLILGTMRALVPRSILQQERIDRINTLLREQLAGVRVIRAFIRERTVADKFTDTNQQLRDVWLSIGLLWAFMFPTAQLIVGFSSAAVVWFGGIRIAAGTMNIGAITAYISYLTMILGAVMLSGFMVMLFPRAQVAANRIQEILDTVPAISSPVSPHVFPQRPLRFVAHDVSLQFPGAQEPVVDHVSLELSPGSTVALIGATGSGKSTILRLFPRLLDPTSGTVTINGVDIRSLSLAEVRSCIAYVPQKTFLFSGTIASNVAGLVQVNEQGIDDERVRHALQIAQAWDFVEKLENGIDAVVESGGMNFSGGQRQRLTIARAVYRCLPDVSGNRQADLIMFDDSFSALDYATDARLRRALQSELDVAVLIVTQRVSTVRDADVIHVLDSGRIVGSGTHDELQDSNQTYQEIIASQLKLKEA